MMKRRSSVLKKKRRGSRPVNLPEDLIMEILSRVPAASIPRLRSTCKGWNALIKDGSFAKKHSNNAPRHSLVIMLIDFRLYLATVNLQSKVAPSVKVTSQFSLKNKSSKQVDISHVHHCDGLLLCTTKQKSLVVWNPVSGETRWIKPRKPYTKFDVYALGKSSCNKYKILRYQSGMYYRDPIKYEIYDFISSSWRVIGQTTDWWFTPRYLSRGVCVNGNTYWHAWRASIPNDVLLNFDYSTERFINVSLPGTRLIFGLSVTKDEQQLCMIASADTQAFDMDVWIATKTESSGATSWTKLLSVAERAYRPHPYCFVNGMNFLADQDNKLILCPGKNFVSDDFLTIVGQDKCIQVDNHDDAESKCSLLVSYVPTLVQIQ